MPTLDRITIYPVKSLDGVAVEAALAAAILGWPGWPASRRRHFRSCLGPTGSVGGCLRRGNALL